MRDLVIAPCPACETYLKIETIAENDECPECGEPFLEHADQDDDVGGDA